MMANKSSNTNKTIKSTTRITKIDKLEPTNAIDAKAQKDKLEPTNATNLINQSEPIKSIDVKAQTNNEQSINCNVEDLENFLQSEIKSTISSICNQQESKINKGKVLAVLNPTQYDNNKLWDKLYNIFESADIETFRKTALSIPLSQVATIKIIFCPKVDVYYPKLTELITAVALTGLNMKDIILIVEDCLIAKLEPKDLKDAYGSYSHIKPSPNTKKSKSTPSANNLPSTPDNNNDGMEFLGNPNFTFNTKTIQHTISMQVLAGFIAVLGITAVVVAFAALNAASCGMPGILVAAVGVGATLAGIGLFKHASDKVVSNYQSLETVLQK